jgi:sodium-dependent dicarboxylate transporter 2/3/5
MRWHHFLQEHGDTRRLGRRIIGTFQHSVPASLIRILGALAASGFILVAVRHELIPGSGDLSASGRNMLFILMLAAGLWMTEAIPAFAVSLLVIAMEIAILARPGAAISGDTLSWETFIHPWSSPLIWLFLGGFVLAHAAVKTGLDSIVARRIIGLFGNRPHFLLFGVMAVTFVLSMFMSNTATAAMMLALLGPVINSLQPSDPYGKGLSLGVAMAAAVGGMGTIIGTPPNAIAAQALSESSPISFLTWMTIGLPPAVALFLLAWGYLCIRFPARQERIPVEAVMRSQGATVPAAAPKWNLFIVLAVFLFVVVMWLFETAHGIPAPVVAFFGIAALSVMGVVTAADMRSLPWDVLILMAGGLALGAGVEKTGLAQWMVGLIPDDLTGSLLVVLFAVMAVLMSNFMSNTATASILVPVVAAFAVGSSQTLVLPVALCCSCAMILPVSTPPNAVAFAGGNLKPGDFIPGGILMALLGPVIIYLWMQIRF